jgi:arginase family enzyme
VKHETRPDAGSALLVITPQPLEAQPPAVMVGLHGFSNQPPVEGSFPLSLIDDWGVDDVMAAAFDSLGNQGSVAVLIDLSVLDLAFEPGSQRARPGGLDPRRLARAAYLSGRHSQVNKVGLVAAVAPIQSALDPPEMVSVYLGPHANLAHVALSFCAGLAAR